MHREHHDLVVSTFRLFDVHTYKDFEVTILVYNSVIHILLLYFDLLLSRFYGIDYSQGRLLEYSNALAAMLCKIFYNTKMDSSQSTS